MMKELVAVSLLVAVAVVALALDKAHISKVRLKGEKVYLIAKKDGKCPLGHEHCIYSVNMKE